MVRRTTCRSAFTLLEMLVALSLMSILATALYASLQIGFDARKRAEAGIAPVRSAALALELLRRDIESAPPPTGILAGVFVGQDARAGDSAADADTVVFCTCAEDPARGGPAIRMIEIALASPEGGSYHVLVRRVTANLLAPTTPEPVEEVLCRNVLSFNIRYFDGAVWLDSWDSSVKEDVLPLAVEVRLRVLEPGSRKTDAGGYELRRVFLLPCGAVPSDEGATTVFPSST